MNVDLDYKHRRGFMMPEMGVGVYMCAYVHMDVCICV